VTHLTGDKKGRHKGQKNLNSDLFKIIKLIMERGLDPCIIFSFSKKDCETYALQMARLDFNTEGQCRNGYCFCGCNYTACVCVQVRGTCSWVSVN
jgi:hypothetical protein